MRCICFIGLLIPFTVLPFVAPAQEIVSAQSGVIHYLEGAVAVDGVPVDHKPAIFPLLKDGSTLKTQKGRAELMLTPGVFLRLDENSSVKMLSSALTSTRLEFLSGSAIFDGLAAQGEIPITVEFKGASVQFAKAGLYRFDSETEVLQAYEGEAVVDQQEKTTRIDPSRLYFFELGTDTKKFSDGTDDEFLDWARNRNQTITEENQIAQADADDANADPDFGAGNSPLFNYAVPPVLPGFGGPNLGGIYPSSYPYSYGPYFYGTYAPTTLFALPPLLGPALIIGRRFGYHAPTSHWPSSTWATTTHWPTNFTGTVHHPVGSYLSYPRPVITTPRPAYSRPVAAPHVSAPAAHAVHR